MLSTPEIQSILADLTYKPGWKFEVYDGRYEGQHVVIWTQVIDAYDIDKMTTLDVHSMLPPCRDREAFLDWLLWRIARIEVHEAREFFRVGGKVYSDPHGEGADHDK